MKLASTLFREKTNVPKKLTTVFNAPGVYNPQYGKTVVTLGGRGVPGNATVYGNVAGYNPDSAGTPAYRYIQETVSQWIGSYAPGYSTYNTTYTAPNQPAPYTTTNGTGGPSSPVVYTTHNYTALSYTPSTPTIPGNANYNPDTPGNVGSPFTLLGVTFPGGNVGSAAPVIGSTPVAAPYTGSGVSVTVPSGAYVTIINN